LTLAQPYEIYEASRLQNPSLIAGWSQDAGRLGTGVVDFLNRRLGAQACADIEPLPFFYLGGVSIEDNVIQFPESKFYCCLEKNLLTFKSETPGREHYRFLTAVLDIVQHYRVKELYTVGGIVSLISHTSPGRVFTVVNQPQLKQTLVQYGAETGLDYQTPPGSRPTLSSFLLWVAKRRELPGVSLWAEVPFYLAAIEDPRACKRLVAFLDKRVELGMDLTELDSAIKEQDEAIEGLRQQNATVSKCLEMLERGIVLSQDEQERLATEVAEFLGGRA
jgi:proteasome assembly chaperone (PAC2) family protein